MIISKTPYRISFFGGGSDYPSWYLKNGGVVLSTTIDKYIYISCRYLPPFFEHKYRFVWSQMENVKSINQIKHKPVREMLKYFNIKNGLEIHYDGDLPARSGMGSSSVFVVGLMNLLNSFHGRNITNKMLAKKFDGKVEYFFDGVHTTPAGSSAIAQTIIDDLVKIIKKEQLF